jgi:zona occludens toxin
MKLIFEYLNKGRQVYTNIVGIKVDGVISVASSINDPFDWRNLPNGSVLVWDEAHEHPAFSEQDLLKTFKIDETHFDDLLQLNSKKGITSTQERQNIQKIEKAKKDALEKRKEEIRDIGRSLLLHGHFGIEIIFITQRPAKLNADVLASVTSHFIMRRKFGMDAAMIWEFGEAMTTWSKSTATYALNKTLWRYPKHLYKFYVSSENHQVRKSFP